MTLPIILIMVLSVVGLSTLSFIRKIFHMLEIIAYFMIISVLTHQTFTVSTLNLEMIQLNLKVSVFWFLHMNLLIIIPCITLWLFYSYFSPSLSLLLKALLTFGWLLSMYGFEVLFQIFGFITFKHWSIGYSFIQWLFVLIISICFIHWFRKLLRKQAII
jgi:hypothetical protein